MRLESRKYLYDVQRAIALLKQFTAGKTFEDYERDAMLRAAVEREFEIVGEAVSQLAGHDESVAARISGYQHQGNVLIMDTPVRNVLIHGYRR